MKPLVQKVKINPFTIYTKNPTPSTWKVPKFTFALQLAMLIVCFKYTKRGFYAKKKIRKEQKKGKNP